MDSTDTQAPARTAADALTDLSAMVKSAHDQAIPVNVVRAIELLHEHASLSTHEDVSALSARVDKIETLLTEAGIEQPAPAPAAPATPGPAL